MNEEVEFILESAKESMEKALEHLEKQFVNRHSADAYVGLMIEDKEYENIEYFLFEQSHDYQHIEENPMKDFEEVLHGNG